MKRVKKAKHMHCLSQVLKGIKRSITIKPSRAERLPITPPELRSLRQYIKANITSRDDQCMLWCASAFAFYGFLRVSEYTNPKQRLHDKNSRTLTCQDISSSSDHVLIRLKKSKTDQYQQGATVTISRNDTHLCPVRAYFKYSAVRGSAHGPFFRFANNTWLTPQAFNKFIRHALPCEPSGTYSSHSFRIGAASTAAAQGYPTHTIQQLGRWASDAYLRYIKLNKSTMSAISRSMANI